MTEQNEEALPIINSLADLLGVNLNDQRVAIATERKSAKVKMHDDSVEVEVVPTNNRVVKIESPRAPGIWISLVDHRDPLAPEGAIYEIEAYMPARGEDDFDAALNGDVASVYVGREGIILCSAARMRAAKLYGEDQERGY